MNLLCIRPRLRQFLALTMIAAAVSVVGADELPEILPRDVEARQALAVAASVIPPDQATTDIVRLAGEYSFGNGFDRNCTLEISPDGRFLYKLCNCENVMDQATGQVVLQDGYVYLQPNQMRQGWPAGMSSVLIPVTWGQRIYLIPQNDILGFSNEINRGKEPVSRGSMGNYLLREGDWDRPVEGKPNLPAEWQERLLDQPVSGLVVGKDPSGRWLISLGKNHGVFDGMELSAWAPDLRRFVNIVVTETGSDTSAIRISNEPPGLLITNWVVYSKVVPPGQAVVEETPKR